MMSALMSPGWEVPARTVTIGGQLDMKFAARPEHLRSVRRIVREHLRVWGVDRSTGDRLVLALHELLANVVVHTHCVQAQLIVQRVPEGVVAIVHDEEPRQPVAVKAGPEDESGRGLELIRQLVDAAQIYESDGGKDVWIRVEGSSDETCVPASDRPALSAW